MDRRACAPLMIHPTGKDAILPRRKFNYFLEFLLGGGAILAGGYIGALLGAPGPKWFFGLLGLI